MPGDAVSVDQVIEARVRVLLEPMAHRMEALEAEVEQLRDGPTPGRPWKDNEEITTAQAAEYMGLESPEGAMKRLAKIYGLTPVRGCGAKQKKWWRFGDVREAHERFKSSPRERAEDAFHKAQGAPRYKSGLGPDSLGETDLGEGDG